MRIPTFLAILTAFLLASCINEEMPENKGIEGGDPLPSFSIVLNDGTTVATSTLRGKVSVIEFFNTGCGDCREFFPTFQALYEEFSGNPDVMVFSIAREEDEASISAYWEAHSLTVPFSPQTDRSVYNLFATVGIPCVYISDPEGVVRYVFTDADHPSLTDLINCVEALGVRR